ncbi:alpha/beta hydrolase [Okeanomitos corallinicola TIOX110]|uniref:Alpha/beta hydrolase n=1 Tax=Okeanomitos corallinicola TIOX110 TaxID=3133117 RepID=A0ABZ2UST2_9CYAN
MNQDIITRNHVNILGQGKQPMLFAHGFGCDQNMWRFITPAFEKDYKIILFDYVGSGKSDLQSYSVERYSHLHGYAQDILEICRELDLKDIIFVGHSVSSMVGVLASIQTPEIFSRLIFVGPSPCYINHPPDYIGGFEKQDIEDMLDIMDKNYIGWANFLAPVVMKNEDKPELTQELEASFCSTDPIIAKAFAKTTFFSDNRGDLPQVTIPSLILQCAEDAIAPTEVGYYLASHLYKSTLKLMNATGHCPHLSHPQETIDLIRNYLTFT